MKNKTKISSVALLLTASTLVTACGKDNADGNVTDNTTDTSKTVDTATPFELVKYDYEGPYDGSSSLPADISDANGYLWYQFEENVGATVLKSSLSQERDSIKVSAVLVKDVGVNGSGAISFNGRNQSVKLNNDFSNTSQITSSTFLHPAFRNISVSMYINPADLDGKQLIYEQGDSNNGIAIGLDGNKIVCALGTGSSETATGSAKVVAEYELSSDAVGNWTQITLAYDGEASGGTAILYINGKSVSKVTGIGAYIPQTLDAAGLGASEWGTNVLGYTHSWYNGLIDDLRIYSVTVEPLGEFESTALYLQSAYEKNYYISVSSGSLVCDCMTAKNSRGWVFTKGLADSEGISFRLTGTDRFLCATDGELSLVDISVDNSEATLKSATFYETSAISVPSWGASTSEQFFSFKTYDQSAYLSESKSHGLTLVSSDSMNDTAALRASFKVTGDQTTLLAGVKGAVYYPSYALNAPQFWKWYDHDIIDRDMQYATDILGINAFRIWVSYEYWLEDPDHFEAAFKDYLELGEKWGIRTMVSLFEGCGDSYDYDSYSTWNRTYTSRGSKSAGWAITSPSSDIYNNRSRWDEPKEFVSRFIDLFGDNSNLLCIEVYNEPWGDARTALALELCEYAVSIQKSVPLTLGTAPSGEQSLENAVMYGMDILQYHDNFPSSASAFQSNANAKVAFAVQSNLPITCTEVQWVNGPANINYPSYSNLATTVERLAQSDQWCPFYWTLMVHPCYLNSYRDNYNMYNGLINEDGSVNSLANAEAIAGGKLDVEVYTENPYNNDSYTYRYNFSDNFMDKHGYKWSAIGSFSAGSGALVGTGVALANDTAFSTISSAAFDISVASGSAGMIVGATGADNGYAILIDADSKVLKIGKLTDGLVEIITTSDTVEFDGKNTLTVTYDGQTLTVSGMCTSLSAEVQFEGGLIGFYSENSAEFDNLSVKN